MQAIDLNWSKNEQASKLGNLASSKKVKKKKINQSINILGIEQNDYNKLQ